METKVVPIDAALLPRHKLKFGDHPPGFAPYKKIPREWRTAG